MSRLTRLRLLGTLLLMLTAACGPTVPLEIAMRQAIIDVFYGAPHKPEPAVAPLPVFQPPPPFSESYPAYAAGPQPSPTPFTCAKLGEFAVPQHPVTPNISNPPPAATYLMRSSGTYSLGSTKGTLPAQLALLRPAAPVPGADQVDGKFQDYQLITGQSTTQYTVFDFRLTASAPASTDQGILLTGLHWVDPVRGNFDFAPQHPLQFFPSPVSVNSSWQAAGVDPIAQTSVVLQGTVTQRDRVNACGVALDSYQAAITGNIVSPTFQLSWTGLYDIGTQYGGLILAEQVKFSGPDSNKNTGDQYSYDETSIIDSEPALSSP